MVTQPVEAVRLEQVTFGFVRVLLQMRSPRAWTESDLVAKTACPRWAVADAIGEMYRLRLISLEGRQRNQLGGEMEDAWRWVSNG